jgi:hypothetical protein
MERGRRERHAGGAKPSFIMLQVPARGLLRE